ncbi:L,D-transpeptidase [Streptomyces sp. NPDC049577]|uniref:L,D-transpeptidase n=1 Tax=Streptomyces sp. NPDC049577 TaxID=3155153 RepID=UPI00342C91AE
MRTERKQGGQRKLTGVLGAIVALPVAAVTIGLAPSASASSSAPASDNVISGQALAEAKAAGKNYTFLEFKKGKDPLNSRLRFVFVQAANPDHVRSWVIDSWRAGSGNGSKDTCATGRGWLPNGTYNINHYYPHHNGGPKGVNGISWDIGNHKCHSGKWRTELFIHSKMLPSGAQGSGPYKWTGNYASNGCIKLSPKDIRELQGLWNGGYPHPAKLYVD